ncbi:MAG: hypothetical protein IKU64_07335 [Bacteroides sp.]|nr:hypothetical protein [Bacteroides sp.]
MKSRIKSMLLACVALTGAFFASCTDDALMEASENYAGRPFELTVQQSSNGSRLALGGENQLETVWEPGDQLVLVNKAGGKAPIYLTCTLAEGETASSAKFTSESGVPSGDYYVIYNYNEDMVYSYKQFQTVDQINEKDELVLWANLNIPENTYSANVDLKHLYAMIRVELINMPENKPWDGYQIGVYSSKKGFPMYRLFTNTAIVDAEYGPDPNSMYSYNYTYFASNRKYHNIRFGQYRGVEVRGEYGMISYDWTQAKSLSALILPADLSNEDIFFYVLDESNRTCYEIKYEHNDGHGVNFQAGTNYTIKLDLSNAEKTTKSVLNENPASDGYTYRQIENAEQWRHAVYRNGGSYEITADINFEDDYFFPINAYRLKGNDKTLSNITLDWSDEDNVGLIKTDAGNYNNMMSTDNKSTVTNLTLDNVIFKGKNEVGALGGKNVFANKCSVIGGSRISGQDYVGGMVGRNEYDSYNDMVDLRVGQSCIISGKNYVGGILGRYMNGNNDSSFYLYSSRTLLKSCKSEATVTATGDYVGGIFGKIGGHRSGSYSLISMSNYEEKYTLSVEKCINEGTVEGVNYVGGIGGDFAVYCYDNTIEDRVVLKESYSEGTVNGVQKVAGIVGATRASINTCYSIGEISASKTEIGGIVGRIEGDGKDNNARIANSYSLATLTVGNNGHIGGIVGNAGGDEYGGSTVINCYYAADPKTYEFGGIVGNSDGNCKVTNCVTTLASLGLNLGPHQINIGPDYDGDGIPEYNNWINADDIVCGKSEPNVTSILAKLSVINADEKYSTNLWDTTAYPWNCVKFASFEVDTDSEDFDNETVNP